MGGGLEVCAVPSCKVSRSWHSCVNAGACAGLPLMLLHTKATILDHERVVMLQVSHARQPLCSRRSAASWSLRDSVLEQKPCCTNAELNCRPTAYETVALPLSYTCCRAITSGLVGRIYTRHASVAEHGACNDGRSGCFGQTSRSLMDALPTIA